MDHLTTAFYRNRNGPKKIGASQDGFPNHGKQPFLVGMNIHLPSGYDIHSLPWKDPPFLIGKPSISIRAMASMANC